MAGGVANDIPFSMFLLIMTFDQLGINRTLEIENVAISTEQYIIILLLILEVSFVRSTFDAEAVRRTALRVIKFFSSN